MHSNLEYARALVQKEVENAMADVIIEVEDKIETVTLHEIWWLKPYGQQLGE